MDSYDFFFFLKNSFGFACGLLVCGFGWIGNYCFLMNGSFCKNKVNI
uniref:Uncharacterized protein n=1 Tax=Rhizophora mucronata TaxID=61149 RepID=A0A2P2IZF8_RHIMU